MHRRKCYSAVQMPFATFAGHPLNALQIPQAADAVQQIRHRALLLAYRFPPRHVGIAHRRSEALYRWLPEYGWAPTVITAQFGAQSPDVVYYPDASIFSRLLGRNSEPTALRRMLSAVKQHSGGMLRYAANRTAGALRQLPGWRDDFASWSRAVVARAIAEGRRRSVELVWSTLKPNSVAETAVAVARELGVPCVLDFRDDLSADIGSNYGPEHWLHRAVSQADCVTISEPVADCALLRGSVTGAGPYLIISGSWHTQQVPAQPAPHFRITHAGFLYGELKYPSMLFQAATALAEHYPQLRQELKLAFVGQDSRLCATATGYAEAAAMIELIPEQPYAKVADLMARSALLAIFNLEREREQLGGIRGKLFDYFGYAWPVLYVGDEPGITGTLLSWAGCGCWAPTLDTLIEVLGSEYMHWRRHGVRTAARNSEALAYCSQRRMAAEFAEVFNAMVDQRAVHCRESLPWDKTFTAASQAQAASSS